MDDEEPPLASLHPFLFSSSYHDRGAAQVAQTTRSKQSQVAHHYHY